MAGTKAGSKKAVKTMKKKYGKDFYAKIGKVGGKEGRTGGFYNDSERARSAGKIGGSVSRRGPNGKHGFTDKGKWVEL